MLQQGQPLPTETTSQQLLTSGLQIKELLKLGFPEVMLLGSHAFSPVLSAISTCRFERSNCPFKSQEHPPGTRRQGDLRLHKHLITHQPRCLGRHTLGDLTWPSPALATDTKQGVSHTHSPRPHHALMSKLIDVQKLHCLVALLSINPLRSSLSSVNALGPSTRRALQTPRTAAPLPTAASRGKGLDQRHGHSRHCMLLPSSTRDAPYQGTGPEASVRPHRADSPRPSSR